MPRPAFRAWWNERRRKQAARMERSGWLMCDAAVAVGRGAPKLRVSGTEFRATKKDVSEPTPRLHRLPTIATDAHCANTTMFQIELSRQG